jgi:hypothetical protein
VYTLRSYLFGYSLAAGSPILANRGHLMGMGVDPRSESPANRGLSLGPMGTGVDPRSPASRGSGVHPRSPANRGSGWGWGSIGGSVPWFKLGNLGLRCAGGLRWTPVDSTAASGPTSTRIMIARCASGSDGASGRKSNRHAASQAATENLNFQWQRLGLLAEPESRRMPIRLAAAGAVRARRASRDHDARRRTSRTLRVGPPHLKPTGKLPNLNDAASMEPLCTPRVPTRAEKGGFTVPLQHIPQGPPPSRSPVQPDLVGALALGTGMHAY